MVPGLGAFAFVFFGAAFGPPPLREVLATQSFRLAGVMRNPDRPVRDLKPARAVRGVRSSSYKDTRAGLRKSSQNATKVLEITLKSA